MCLYEERLPNLSIVGKEKKGNVQVMLNRTFIKCPHIFFILPYGDTKTFDFFPVSAKGRK